jgi:hypothetical protein
MKTLFLTLVAATLLAQNVTRVIEFEPDGTDQANRIVSLLQASGMRVHYDPVLGLATIIGPESDVAKGEEFFRKYYKPRASRPTAGYRNTELTIHILTARKSSDPSDLPPTLNATATELTRATGLNSFRLVESQIIRVRDGEAIAVRGTLQTPVPPDTPSSHYSLGIKSVSVGNTIGIKALDLVATLNYAKEGPTVKSNEVVLRTSVDVKPGQQTVIGKANSSPSDGAIILILSARTVE